MERKAEATMAKRLDRTFYTIVRSVDELKKMVEADPFATFDLAADAKRVVTFLRESRKPAQRLPIEMDGARILAAHGCEVFTAYVPSPRGPVFMTLIEKTFGSDVSGTAKAGYALTSRGLTSATELIKGMLAGASES